MGDSPRIVPLVRLFLQIIAEFSCSVRPEKFRGSAGRILASLIGIATREKDPVSPQSGLEAQVVF